MLGLTSKKGSVGMVDGNLVYILVPREDALKRQNSANYVRGMRKQCMSSTKGGADPRGPK